MNMVGTNNAQAELVADIATLIFIMVIIVAVISTYMNNKKKDNGQIPLV